MIEVAPSRPKNKAERFAETDEGVRDVAIRLAVHYSSVATGDISQVEDLIKQAAADAREPDGTVVLASSGRKLSDVGGKNILSLAIRIAEKAEQIVRSRIVSSWAFNILYSSSPPSVANPRALAEVERVLKSPNRISELDRTRYAGPLSSLVDNQFDLLKKGVELYDPALTVVFDNDGEELKLLQHWNTSRPSFDALVDDPSYDPSAGSAMVSTLLNGQRYLLESVPKQFVNSLTDVEHARLAEFLGTNEKANRTWYGKKEPLSPERQALLTRFPALRHLLARMEQARLPAQPPKLPEKSERRKRREDADEAYGRKHIHPASLKVLEEHWKGADAVKVGIYLRLWSNQVRFLRAGGLPHSPQEEAIYREGQSILNEAEDRAGKKRQGSSTSDRSTTVGGGETVGSEGLSVEEVQKWEQILKRNRIQP